MTRLTVSEIHAGTQLQKAPFLLATMTRATDRNGDVYLKLTLRDKSGDIEARYWRVPPEVVDRLSAGSGVAVSGNVSEYRGSSQVIISDIQTCSLGDMDEYLPVARRPHQEMVDELQQAGVAGLNNGLSEAENQELFETPHIPLMVSLVLKGLRARQAPSQPSP